MLIQPQWPTLKQRRNNVTNFGTNLIQHCFILSSTLVKDILNAIWLVMIMDLQIDEQLLFR